jgi:hypothetical protein
MISTFYVLKRNLPCDRAQQIKSIFMVRFAYFLLFLSLHYERLVEPRQGINE